MSDSNDDSFLSGCGCFTIILIALAIHFQVDIGHLIDSIGNIFKGILAIGAVLLVLGLFAAFASDGSTISSAESGKAKRKEKPKKMQKAERVIYADRPARSLARSQASRVTRLEVPGGYVPFEMTKTETKTEDTFKRETTIKTYVDSREVTAILKDKDVHLLRDSKQ